MYEEILIKSKFWLINIIIQLYLFIIKEKKKQLLNKTEDYISEAQDIVII